MAASDRRLAKVNNQTKKFIQSLEVILPAPFVSINTDSSRALEEMVVEKTDGLSRNKGKLVSSSKLKWTRRDRDKDELKLLNNERMMDIVG